MRRRWQDSLHYSVTPSFQSFKLYQVGVVTFRVLARICVISEGMRFVGRPEDTQVAVAGWTEIGSP
jgi:hypothetical protein